MKEFLLRCLLISALMFMFCGFMGPADAKNHDKPKISPVPEPSTLALLGAGIAGIGGYLYVKRKNKK